MSKPHSQADLSLIQKDPAGNRTIRPRSLNIVWGNDESYWKLPAKGSTKDEDAAELLQVSWLEITGSVELIAGKKYQLTFDVELLPEAFGWKDLQAFVMAKVGKKGKYNWKKVQLQPEKDKNVKDTIPKGNDTLIIEVPPGQTDTTLQFGLYEVWSGKWKGGLKIYNAKVTVVT